MLKIYRFNCAGLDVHKNLIVATIGITDKKTRVTEYIQKDFSSLNFDLYNLKNWLIEHECFDVCMESTGKYWIPVFNVLETYKSQDNLTNLLQLSVLNFFRIKFIFDSIRWTINIK